MKRHLIFTLLIVLSAQVFGQTHTPCRDCDTIPNRHRNYFYNQWHDSCDCYLARQNCELEITMPIQGGTFGAAKRFTTKEPLRIKGLTALTMINPSWDGSYCDTIRLPEYLYLYQKVCPDGNELYVGDSCMLLLDSVRWDTVKPHYMEFKPYRDSNIYDYCYAYDVYFDKTWIVDTVFYIMGTLNSTMRPEGGLHCDWLHIPTGYASYECTGGCAPTDWALYKETFVAPGQSQFWGDFHYPNIFGFYLPIVDNDSLSVLSCDTMRGNVTGSGFIPHGHTATMSATAKLGYRFAYWSDGNTSNPRNLVVLSDTTFVAYFFHNQLVNCTIAVSASDSAMGTVSGGGQYREGDTATLTATPTDSRYIFDGWSDGNTDNPRQFIVLQSASYVAQFRDPLGMQSVEESDGVIVAPNPTNSLFGVTCREAITELAVVNANGVIVYRARPDSPKADIDAADWAAGHYLVTVTTPSGRITKKIVVTH